MQGFEFDRKELQQGRIWPSRDRKTNEAERATRQYALVQEPSTNDLPDSDRRPSVILHLPTLEGAWSVAGLYTGEETETLLRETGPRRILRGHFSRG